MKRKADRKLINYFKLVFGASCMATGAAHAQSSITLYGIVAGNVAYTDNVQTQATSSSGRPAGHSQIAQMDNSSTGLAASRWGLRGTEDLGQGIKTIFQFENGFSINNGAFGQGGTEFGRQAWFGLATTNYGSFTLGRQSDVSVEFVSPLTYGWYWGNIAIHPADYDNLNFTHRINNSAKYVSCSYDGFRFGALYSLGGVAGDFTQKQLWSLGANYTGAAVTFAVAIVNARNPNSSLYGTNANASATGNNLGSAGSATAPEYNPAIAGFASANTQQTISAATTYTIGSATVGVTYANTQFRGLGSNASLNSLNYSGSTMLSTVGVNLRYQINPFLRVGSSLDYTYGGRVDGAGGARYGQLNVGADYSLSKATDLFMLGAYQHASGTDSSGRSAVAAIGYSTPSSTDHQMLVSAGIKHNF